MSFLSTNAGVIVVDSRTRPGTITLPLTTQIPQRVLQFKDLYGAFGRSSLTLSTQAGERFDDGTTSKVFTDPFTFLTFYAGSTTTWAQLGGTQTNQQTMSSLIVSSLTIGTGYGWLQLPPVQTLAISTNTFVADNVTAIALSTQVLYVSSIIGVTTGGGTGNVTTANLTSTVVGLGTVGYISTPGGGGGISAGNLTSTVQGLATAGYLSSVSGGTGFVSSLTVNALTLGTGSGWLQLPPVQTIYSSTIYTQAQALYTLSSFFGGFSTLTALDFYGLFGNYNNTVIAEVSTGAGTQELLFFKGSSVSDRFRFQTTGSFVVETGVSSRLWSDTTVPTLSNTTPAFIINTSSNVGIQTASPGAALDVAGTARAITLSSQQLFTSSVQATVVTAPTVSSLVMNASTVTAGIVTASTVNTNALSLATNPAWILMSPIQTLGVSTNTLWADQAYINTGTLTTGTISSVTTNSLTLGAGATWIQMAPIQTSIVSSIIAFADTTFFNTVNIGSLSTVNSLEFAGLFNNYNNTVLAEISTGAGTQELLVFRGSSASDRVRVQTTGTFVVETGVSQRLFNSNTTQTLSNATPAFIINTRSNVGIQTASPGATLDVAGTARAIALSSQQLFVSSVAVGTIASAILSSQQLFASSVQATVVTAPTVSSLVINASTATVALIAASTVTTNAMTLGTNTSWIFTSPIQTLAISTNTVWSDQTYINNETVTTGNISAITTNSLTLGAGSSWILTSPIQTGAVSTIYLYANQPFFDTVNIGSVSTMNSLEFAGLFNGYNNTVLAEISTGAGTQELLVFKGSSASDRVRVQTTGAFVVETGVSQRLFNSNTTQTLSNATPAFIININSNVGIQTSNPTVPLDVAGAGRFQFVSTMGFNTSSINGQAYWAPELSTVAGLGSSRYLSTIPPLMSTAGILASSITTSSIITSSLQVNSLTIGTGTGWVNLGPIQAVAVSSLQENTNALYATSAYIGNLSTLNTLQYNGLFGNYNNSVVAEVSTGAGTQELLFFKGSSTSDRFRFQTTGAFVVETGVSSRLFNSNTTQTLSNATPAFVININSNVGIQTSNPTAPLDVAGTIRAINLSSQTAVVSSIVSLNLSSVQGSVSSLTVNSLQVGDGTGWITIGPIQTAGVSTIQGNAQLNTTVTTSTLVLNASSITGVASPFVSQGRLTADQNIPANTNDVMVQFVSDFDPNNWLLNSGTSTARVRPTIAGYYSVTFQVWWATGTGTNQVNIQIRKNGQTIAIAQNQVNTVIGLTLTITKIAFMNGSSDYFDFPAFTGTGGATQAVQFGGSALSPGTYYSVSLIR